MHRDRALAVAEEVGGLSDGSGKGECDMEVGKAVAFAQLLLVEVSWQHGDGAAELVDPDAAELVLGKIVLDLAVVLEGLALFGSHEELAEAAAAGEEGVIIGELPELLVAGVELPDVELGEGTEEADAGAGFGTG